MRAVSILRRRQLRKFPFYRDVARIIWFSWISARKPKDHGTYSSAVDRSLPSPPSDAFVSFFRLSSPPSVSNHSCVTSVYSFLSFPGEEMLKRRVMLAQGRAERRTGNAGGTKTGLWWIVKYWPDWRAPRTTFSSDAFASMATDDNEDDHYYCYTFTATIATTTTSVSV